MNSTLKSTLRNFYLRLKSKFQIDIKSLKYFGITLDCRSGSSTIDTNFSVNGNEITFSYSSIADIELVIHQDDSIAILPDLYRKYVKDAYWSKNQYDRIKTFYDTHSIKVSNISVNSTTHVVTLTLSYSLFTDSIWQDIFTPEGSSSDHCISIITGNLVDNMTIDSYFTHGNSETNVAYGHGGIILKANKSRQVIELENYSGDSWAPYELVILGADIVDENSGDSILQNGDEITITTKYPIKSSDNNSSNYNYIALWGLSPSTSNMYFTDKSFLYTWYYIRGYNGYFNQWSPWSGYTQTGFYYKAPSATAGYWYVR